MTLYDIFKYNGLTYPNIINDNQRIIIDNIVAKIKENGFEDRILQYSDKYFYISDNLQTGHSFIIDTNFDKDLRHEIEKAHLYAMGNS